MVLVEVPLDRLLHWLIDRQVVTDASWEASSAEIQETIQKSLTELLKDTDRSKQSKREPEEEDENKESTEVGVYEEILSKFLITENVKQNETEVKDGTFTIQDNLIGSMSTRNTLRQIDFYQCQEIMDLLVENEERKGAKVKNIFGFYRNPFLRTWNKLLLGYQKNNIFLASSALQLVSLASYSLPALKNTLKTNDKILNDLSKRIEDIRKRVEKTRKDYQKLCHEYRIEPTTILVSQKETPEKAFHENDHKDYVELTPLLPPIRQIAEPIVMTTFELKILFEPITESLKSNDLIMAIHYYYSFLFSKMKDVKLSSGNKVNQRNETPHEQNKTALAISSLQDNFHDASSFNSNELILSIEKFHLPTLQRQVDLLNETGHVFFTKDRNQTQNKLEKVHENFFEENERLLDDKDSRMKLCNDLLELQSFLNIRQYECSQGENIFLCDKKHILNIYASSILNQFNEKETNIPERFQESPSFLSKCKQSVNNLLELFNDKHFQHLLLTKQSIDVGILEALYNKYVEDENRIEGIIQEEDENFFGKYLQQILSRFKALSVQEQRLYRSTISCYEKKKYYLQLQKETNQKYIQFCQQTARLKRMIEKSVTSVINASGNSEARQFLITECDF